MDVNCGVFNNRPISERQNYFKNRLEMFTKKPEGAETLADVRRRMTQAILEINQKHRYENILIVSHGDSLWMLETALGGLGNEASLAWSDKNFLHVGEVRSLKFNNWPFNEEGELDLHRPYIDEVYLACLKCDKKVTRIKEVADVWFDSGGMPFASEEYPQRYPADYICEAIDQTRGWFYTLLAIGVLMQKGTPYKNVISLGLILDKNGQKMSKSKGNAVDPWAMADKYGIDLVRWYFYTVNPPGEPKKFDEAELVKIRNKFHNLIFNSYVFLETYSGDRKRGAGAKASNILDKWIFSRLHETILNVTRGLENYEVGDAAKAIGDLVDDLSRWYIRRSRRRVEALPILGSVLTDVAKLLAPFCPFFAEALHQSLSEKSSVHLQSYPKADKKLIDYELDEDMVKIRRWASLALAQRSERGIKVRQPLTCLKVKKQTLQIKDNHELLSLLADEANVKDVFFDDSIAGEVELDCNITPELKKEGLRRELTRTIQDLRHEAGCRPGQLVSIFLVLPGDLRSGLQLDQDFYKQVAAKDVKFARGANLDLEKKEKLDNQEIWLGLKK